MKHSIYGYQRPIGEALRHVIHEGVEKKASKTIRLLTALSLDWPLLAGEKFAPHSRPAEIKSSRGEKKLATLVVKARRAKLLEVEAAVPLILERITLHYGYALFGGIQVVADMEAEKSTPPQKKSQANSLSKLDEIHDKNLQQVLKKMVKEQDA